MTTAEEIMATLEEYTVAYCAKDLDRLMAIFDDGEDISLIGTGADELCAGREAVAAVFSRNFAAATATRFEWHWKQITHRENCAVVAISLTIHLETDQGALSVPVRWTVSVRNVGGVWKWLHRHASSAAGSQKDGAAYPVSNSD